MESIPNTPGIYVICHINSSSCYIGSAVNLARRKMTHYSALNNSTHANPHLQRAWDKYGASSFQFIILEHVENKKQLIEREQHWIDLKQPEYNIRKIAESNLGITWTEEARKRVTGRKLSPERGARHSALMKGRTRNPESVAKMAATNTGKKRPAWIGEKISAAKKGIKPKPENVEKLRGKKRTPEQRAKMSVAQKSANRVMTDEYRAKLSAASKGRPGTKESSERMIRINAAKKGKPLSEEHKTKISEANKGRVSSNLGKKHSEEYKRKMSEGTRGKPKSPEHAAKVAAALRNRTLVRIAKEAEKPRQEINDSARSFDPSQYKNLSLWDNTDFAS